MTFVGGELGIEEHLTALHRLRRTRPEIGLGSADHLGVRADDDGVAAILRDGGGRTSLVLVELAGREVDVATTLLRPVPHEHPPRDLLAAAARHGDAATREGDLVRCRLGPYGTRVLALHDVPIESRREEGSA
jgi:hypothetical protein